MQMREILQGNSLLAIIELIRRKLFHRSPFKTCSFINTNFWPSAALSVQAYTGSTSDTAMLASYLRWCERLCARPTPSCGITCMLSSLRTLHRHQVCFWKYASRLHTGCARACCFHNHENPFSSQRTFSIFRRMQNIFSTLRPRCPLRRPYCYSPTGPLTPSSAFLQLLSSLET